MARKINSPIVGYEVMDSASTDTNAAAEAPADKKHNTIAAASVAATPTGAGNQQALTPNTVEMHEKIKRPEVLIGSTYKIKSPLSPHALYVTINDLVLNPGTPDERRRPFEIFINSRNMDHFQWIVALTRIISAVFRKGGEVAFLVDELRSVFDPKGGYFKKGGRMMPSLVAEIGDVIYDHMRSIGLIHDPDISDEQKRMMSEKRKAYEVQRSIAAGRADAADTTDFPDKSQLCNLCMTKAVIYMDGCMVCLNCGDSKCG